MAEYHRLEGTEDPRQRYAAQLGDLPVADMADEGKPFLNDLNTKNRPSTNRNNTNTQRNPGRSIANHSAASTTLTNMELDMGAA